MSRSKSLAPRTCRARLRPAHIATGLISPHPNHSASRASAQAFYKSHSSPPPHPLATPPIRHYTHLPLHPFNTPFADHSTIQRSTYPLLIIPPLHQPIISSTHHATTTTLFTTNYTSGPPHQQSKLPAHAGRVGHCLRIGPDAIEEEGIFRVVNRDRDWPDASHLPWEGRRRVGRRVPIGHHLIISSRRVLGIFYIS